MKKVKLRSMAKRMLPVMLIPILLFGNYATITASAEEVTAQEKAVEEKATEEKKSEEKASEETSKEDKAKEEKAAEEKAKEDKAKEEKAAEEKAKEDNSKEEKAKEDKSKEEKAKEDKSKEEKASETKASEDKKTTETTDSKTDKSKESDESDKKSDKNEDSSKSDESTPDVVEPVKNVDDVLENKQEITPEETEKKEDTDKKPVKKKDKKVTISFDIQNKGNSGLKISAEDKNDIGRYYSFNVDGEEDSAEVVFSYSIASFYELYFVSGDEFTVDAKEHTITCKLEDLKDGENKFKFTGKVDVTDKDAPAISEPGAKGDADYTGSNGEAVVAGSDKSKPAFTVKVTDEGSGVDKVYAVDSYGTQREMSGDDGSYSWSPSNYGNYKIVKVIAKDKLGNKAESGVGDIPLICYYASDEEKDFRVNTKTEDWYSLAAHNESNFMLEVTGISNREVQEITVSDVSTKVDISRSNYGGRYTFRANIPLPVKEGEKEYEVKCLFYGDKEAKTIAKKTVRIDNTAPSAEIKVDGEEEKLTPFERFLRLYDRFGWFASNKDINVLIKVPKNCDGETKDKKTSGFYGIVYNVNGQRREKTINDASGKSDKEYYVFEERVRSYGGLSECKYDVEVVSIRDYAGNVADHVEGGTGSFVIDKSAPTIVYDVDGMVAQDENRMYFGGNARGTVTIEDMDLDIDSIKFTEGSGENFKYAIPSYNEKESDGKHKAVYDFRLEGDGTYKIETYAKDTLDQENTALSNEMVVDTTAPKIEISYDKEAPSADGSKYYAQNVQVTVKVDEKWLDETKSFVYIKKLDVSGAEVGHAPLNDWSGDLGDESHQITFTTDGDGMYQISVEAYDMSENHESAEGNKFGVDTTVPEVTLTFDENDPQNDKYYNKPRTATLTVTDFSFYNEGETLDIDQKVGGAEVDGWANTGLNTYTRTIKFAEDGFYSFNFLCKDRAGNESKNVYEKEFVIDRTSPEINVTYNKIAVGNEKFYKDTRVANVDIKEMSFADKLVEVTPQSIPDVSSVPALAGFASNNFNNVSHISFSEDGTYGYVIKCTDLAGNTSKEFTSDVFIIDKTAPEVTFSGVENYSANNGVVAPSVVYGDKYIDIDASKVALKGANNGGVNVECAIKPIENGFSVSYSDFSHDKKMDDLYVLEATVRDKAGNETKDKLVFSVNRHGSVFVIGDVAKKFNEKYYINEPKDITITEINIDELTQKNVSISRDGDIKDLRKGKDFSVKQQGNETSWKTYTYTISKNNFNEDGVYALTVYSKDKATNVQDNKSRDAEVSFAIDMTAPGIVAAGIEQGGVYKQESLDFNVNVTDNMGVSKLSICNNGEEIDSCTGEEREEKGGVRSLTLKEADKVQEITVIAEDLAGNKETMAIGGILVTTKQEVIDDNKTALDPEPGPKPGNVPSPANSMSYFVFAIAAIATLSVGGGAIWLIRMKK